MKALVYLGKESMEHRDVPEPQAMPGAAIVKVHACGICGSDMHGYHGYDPRRVPPMIMGHEMAGVVESGQQAGRRVTVNPLLTCGICDECVSGAQQLCENQRNIGLPPHAGGFADRIVVPQTSLVDIPDDMDFTTAALSEPLAVAYHAFQIGVSRLRRPLSATRVFVLGGGAIDLATALVAIAQGAGSVMLGETSPVRRATASAASSSIIAYDPLDESATRPASADLIFDAVGAKATREAAFRLARRGATIVHLGLLPGAEGVDVRRMTLGEIAFVGSYCYSMADFRETVALLSSGRLGPLNWVETRRMEDGAQAFADLDRGRTAAAKLVLVNRSDNG